jgi:hypothetical protein
MKETAESTKAEKEYIDRQMESLQPTEINLLDRSISVQHKLMFTMVDQKVCASITGRSSQSCYICGAKPTEMNKLDAMKQREVDYSTYEFGLSTLHAWIRSMELVLHIAYRVDIKKWKVSGEAAKAKFESRKTIIQAEFKRKAGFKPDVPRAGGSGSSNDGNMARRFFADPALTAEITEVDETFIARLSVILGALCSGYELNLQRYKEYCLETARLYVSLYEWYYMSSSVHKILIHSSEIVSAALLPIGQLSEDAQEAQNKYCKKFREQHTRKCSR